jgi:hypothetical protein
MRVRRILRERYVAGNVTKTSVFRRGDYVDLFPLQAGLVDSLCRPCACIDIISRTAFGDQVHRGHTELHTGATLHEKHMIVVAEPKEPFYSVFYVVYNVIKPF